MADAPRITVDEAKKRMDAGEKFTFIDVRNPQAWAGSDSMLPGAIRLSLDNVEEKLPKIPKNRSIVTYCT
jgi:rhodanese-related sulfurtransferase